MIERVYNPVTKTYYSIRRRSRVKSDDEKLLGDWKPRTRNKDGSWRRKRSDAAKRGKYVKPSLSARIEHALTFIDDFENSGEETIWLGKLKRILRGEKNEG